MKQAKPDAPITSEAAITRLFAAVAQHAAALDASYKSPTGDDYNELLNLIEAARKIVRPAMASI